ncbi:MAG: type II CAAX endopeptidase family protein [Spirochaetia bacterium]|jgi:membrane protease YdiL (CAAX protease family)
MPPTGFRDEDEAGLLKTRSANLLDAVLFILVFLVSEILLEIFVLPFLNVGAKRNLLVAAEKIVSFAIVFLVVRKRLGGSLVATMPFLSAPATSYLLVAAGVIGLHLFLEPIEAFLSRTSPSYHYYSLRLGALYMPNDIAGTILSTIIVAPAVEELLFRGVILRGFFQNYRISTALLLSSLLFSLCHHNPAQFIGPFFSGVLFGAAYLRTNSVFPCLAGHMLTNGIWFFARANKAASELLSLGLLRGDDPVLLLVREGLGILLVALSFLLLVLPAMWKTVAQDNDGSHHS